MKDRQISSLPKELLIHPTRDKVYDYVAKHPRCKRADLYKFGNESSVRVHVRNLITQGMIKQTPCDCGETQFLEITNGIKRYGS